MSESKKGHLATAHQSKRQQSLGVAQSSHFQNTKTLVSAADNKQYLRNPIFNVTFLA